MNPKEPASMYPDWEKCMVAGKKLNGRKMFKIKTIKPQLDKIVTTANRYGASLGIDGIIDDSKSEGYIKEYQTVLAVSDGTPTSIKVGDVVLINPTNYMKPVHSNNRGSVTEQDSVEMVINFPMITVNDGECLFLSYRDIDAVIEGEEIEEVGIVE